MKDFKDFIAGIGEINVIVYLIYVCTGLALSSSYIGQRFRIEYWKIVLTILGILYVILF